MQQPNAVTAGTGAEKLFLSWEDLMEHCSLTRDDFKTSDDDDDLPDIYLQPAINPASFLPLLLPSNPEFLTISHQLLYGQPHRLTRLLDCISRTVGINTAAGDCASDVLGPVPLWANLGTEAGRLEEAVAGVSRDMEGWVTVLHDKSLSYASVAMLERMTGEREGWQVKRVGE